MPGLVPPLLDNRSYENGQDAGGQIGAGVDNGSYESRQDAGGVGGYDGSGGRNPESGPVSRSVSVLTLRWWPGRGCGPGLLTPQVRAGDDPGQDAQTAPQRLLLLGGVRRRPLVS